MSEHIGSLLDAFLDNELSPSMTRIVEAHLECCAQCQRELKQRRQLIELLKEAAPIPIVRSEDQFVLDVYSQLKPRVSKDWTFQRILKVGWQAIPVGLLLTIIFIQIAFMLGNATQFIPGGKEMLLGSLPGLPGGITLSDSAQMIIELFRIYYLPAWDWITGIIATFIISITYIAWMVIWWGQQQSANNHRMAL